MRYKNSTLVVVPLAAALLAGLYIRSGNERHQVSVSATGDSLAGAVTEK